MTADNLYQEIGRIAEERFKEEDLNDCFLVDIKGDVSKLEVFIDSDSGVKFWQCQKLSRAIEAYLDDSQTLGEKYTLEVSSPGVDQPLKFRRQYPRNLGRKLSIQLADGELIEGKFESFSGDEIELKVQGAKKGQFKKRVINFEDIVSTKVMISFSKKK